MVISILEERKKCSDIPVFPTSVVNTINQISKSPRVVFMIIYGLGEYSILNY